ILDAARASFTFSEGPEISLECHPSTVDRPTLRGYRLAGVNRLSLGAESLDPGDLARIGRNHGPDSTLEAIRLARDAGFDNLGLDLMYGLPGQTLRSWNMTLAAALAANPEHLSLYPLSVEPRTVFARRLREGRLDLPSDDRVAKMYDLACQVLRSGGYEHYEI